MAHTCNPRTLEAEAGGSYVQGHPGLQDLVSNNNNKKNKKHSKKNKKHSKKKNNKIKQNNKQQKIPQTMLNFVRGKKKFNKSLIFLLCIMLT
jgi:hypothetical protein